MRKKEIELLEQILRNKLERLKKLKKENKKYLATKLSSNLKKNQYNKKCYLKSYEYDKKTYDRLSNKFFTLYDYDF